MSRDLMIFVSCPRNICLLQICKDTVLCFFYKFCDSGFKVKNRSTTQAYVLLCMELTDFPHYVYPVVPVFSSCSRTSCFKKCPFLMESICGSIFRLFILHHWSICPAYTNTHCLRVNLEISREVLQICCSFSKLFWDFKSFTFSCKF